MPELTVNGKQVVLRDRLPAKHSWKILELLRKGSEASFDEEALLLSITVLSWEFEGDPSAPESYVDLDLFSEFLPLARTASRYLVERLTPLDGLGKATWLALTQQWPMPYQAVKWMLILKTGWTLEYVNALDVETVLEGFAIMDAMAKARMR